MSGYIASRNATPPLLQKGRHGRPDQQQWNDAVFQFIRQQQIKNVIIVSRWRSNLKPQLGKEPNYQSETFRQAFHFSMEQLARLGINVWVMRQIPDQQLDISRALINAKKQAQPVPSGVTQQQYDENQRDVTIAFDTYQDHPYIKILDVAPFCFLSGKSLIGNESATYYADQIHLSQVGAEVIAKPVLLPILEEIKIQRQFGRQDVQRSNRDQP